MIRLLAALALLSCLSLSPAALAQDAGAIVHLLDYIAVDYPEAVSAGAVRNEGEFKEMTEFSASVRAGIAKLPAHPLQPKLVEAAAQLERLVASKSDEARIAEAATALKRSLIEAYRIAVAPRAAPDLGRAKQLFAEHCAGCHGAAGRGDGPLAKGMDPAPSDFGDRERQRRRSVHGLYNTITLGVGGTAMRAFGELAEADRWALAYLAAGWGAAPEAIESGKAAWGAGRHRETFKSHADVTGPTPLEIESAHGPEAAAVLAYLRSEPVALDRAKPDPIEFARARIRESASLHAAGRIDEAVAASLAAYLEGFELAEAALAAVDADRVVRIERLMMEYRHAIKSGATADDVRARAGALDEALREGAGALGGSALSPTAAALASFVILLREGLEAVLVVTALLAFLRRSRQARAIPYLHAGWIAALALGIATWVAATWLVEVSGAGRELTEGVTALVASAMLLYVGFWLHDKSHAQAWQGFLMRGAAAVGPGAAWGLALMAFLAVYREVFETVLFYQALWTQAAGAQAAILIGAALGALALAAITWAMLRFSLRLPLGLFFGASGILLAVLAVVLAGNGVAALQEAGALEASPVPFVTVSWLGIHPSVQGLATQFGMAALAIALFLFSRRRTHAAARGGPPA